MEHDSAGGPSKLMTCMMRDRSSPWGTIEIVQAKQQTQKKNQPSTLGICDQEGKDKVMVLLRLDICPVV